MTKNAIAAIKELNRLKREIKEVEVQLEFSRVYSEYNRLNEQLAALYISMIKTGGELVSSLTTTIELSRS